MIFLQQPSEINIQVLLVCFCHFVGVAQMHKHMQNEHCAKKKNPQYSMKHCYRLKKILRRADLLKRGLFYMAGNRDANYPL